VLVGDVGERTLELLREIARSQEMTIYAGAVDRDHVRMLISAPPHLSVSRAVQCLKVKSSHRLLSEFPVVRKRYWDQHQWGRGYRVASSGNVEDEVWKKYIVGPAKFPFNLGAPGEVPKNRFLTHFLTDRSASLGPIFARMARTSGSIQQQHQNRGQVSAWCYRH
jgi:putative transposase